MATPATELQKLLELRDAGELTEAEFATAKARVLRPGPQSVMTPSSRRRGWGLFASFGRGLFTIIVATGVLIGATTLIALTEAGAVALGALGLMALALVLVFLFMNEA
ncbi:SHOCT domain-containing protein [Jannaschia formosa]|uniref:SHOCT domain-containing protein n=1 Tax=Jannaschia formosa TaxID=2259592 RepID=UPI000E1C1DFE|nr:SHOCT domain-containing protein [Jannaschia formosa]TFL18987.1 SHOCT domain-containing protein [Jannaschia formosa]